jgi:hypothetical protein
MAFRSAGQVRRAPCGPGMGLRDAIINILPGSFAENEGAP